MPQPMRLRCRAGDQVREHTSDFLADTRSARWLTDIGPAELVGERDLVAFVAAPKVALLVGWLVKQIARAVGGTAPVGLWQELLT